MGTCNLSHGEFAVMVEMSLLETAEDFKNWQFTEISYFAESCSFPPFHTQFKYKFKGLDVSFSLPISG